MLVDRTKWLFMTRWRHRCICRAISNARYTPRLVRAKLAPRKTPIHKARCDHGGTGICWELPACQRHTKNPRYRADRRYFLQEAKRPRHVITDDGRPKPE